MRPFGYTVMCPCGFFADRVGGLTATKAVAAHPECKVMIDRLYEMRVENVLAEAERLVERS